MMAQYGIGSGTSSRVDGCRAGAIGRGGIGDQGDDTRAIPLIDGELGLSRWQNIFFCEFDGPRRDRCVVVTIIADG